MNTMELDLKITSDEREEAYSTGFALVVVDIMEQVMMEYLESGKSINGAIFRLEVLKRLQDIYAPLNTLMVVVVMKLVDAFIEFSTQDWESQQSSDEAKDKVLYS